MAQMYIGGEWVDAKNGATYEVKNPANGQTIDTAPLGAAADANAAVESAKAAFKEWAAMAPDARAEILHKGINAAKEQVNDLAALLTKEQGKPFMESKGELNHCLHGMSAYPMPTPPNLAM